MNSVTSSSSPLPSRLRGSEAVAAARGTESAANCLATPFARLMPPKQVFPFPQTAPPAANKDSRLLPALAQRSNGALSRGFREALSPRVCEAGWRGRGPSQDTHLPSPSAGQLAGGYRAVRNNYQQFDGGPAKSQVQVLFEIEFCPFLRPPWARHPYSLGSHICRAL